MAQFNRFGTKEIVRPGLDFGPQRLPGAPSWDQTPSRDIPGRDIPGRGNTPEQTSITQTTKEDFVNRPVSRDDFIGSILSTESCGVIDKFADDCRIASCKDEDRNRINFSDSDDIEVGAICRIKCRQVKATRCRCCKEGFIVRRTTLIQIRMTFLDCEKMPWRRRWRFLRIDSGRGCSLRRSWCCNFDRHRSWRLSTTMSVSNGLWRSP